jgi:predicted RNA-binding Zn ribbon-like protein
MEKITPPSAANVTPLFIADEVALDFVNTAYGVDPDRRECLASDEHVLDWLRRAGLTEGMDSAPPAARRGALLRAALELRESAAALLEHRKAGSLGDASVLNRILAMGTVHEELVWKKGQAPRLARHLRVTSAEAVLVSVAEAIAKLLAEADFDLVRKCESADCTLWYYDRTKSHHRRWCSMAMCGNRAKVAAFRARHKSD